VAAASGRTFASRSPFDDSVVAEVAAGGPADARAAVEAAAAAAPGWAALPAGEKRALFLRAAQLLEERTPSLIDLLARETGASTPFAGVQLSWAANLLRHAAGWVYADDGTTTPTDFPHTLAMARRKPLGVVASYTPWNGATVLAWRAVVLPLAAGNTVVVKPSEHAPITAGLVIGDIVTEAGFPAGVVNVVTHAPGAAEEISDLFCEHPAVRCINFTGSARVGRLVAARAGATLTRTVLELGGYNQVVVRPDADLATAARLTAFSAFFHQGQICMNARRALVHRDLAEPFAAAVAQAASALPQGDPADPRTIVGPLIDDAAVAAAEEAVASAVARGARRLTGGGRTGRVMAPVVLTDVPDDHPLAREEIFAPILVVRPVGSDAEAVDLVNGNQYGLTCSIMTADVGAGLALAERIDSGAVHVNAPTVNDEAHLPLGGVKQSGWGRSGRPGLDDFSEIRWVTAELGTRELPL
jgi:vanillin dehydrogenase